MMVSIKVNGKIKNNNGENFVDRIINADNAILYNQSWGRRNNRKYNRIAGFRNIIYAKSHNGYLMKKNRIVLGYVKNHSTPP